MPSTLKAVICLIVVMIAFLMLVVFMEKKESLIASGDYGMFVNLTIIGMGLLIVLVYLVSQPHSASHHSTKKKRRE